MKKLQLLLVFILLIFACESGPPNPLYLDSNGITIKAHKWAKIGDEGIINDVRYTIVDLQTLKNLIRSGNSYERVCTTFITNMSELFSNTSTSQNISNWDVSNVENMHSMFSTSKFNMRLNNWDVSSVTDMSGMFSEASDFNQDIGSWDVTSVTTMRDMFESASSFNQPIGDWDVSNVNSVSNMFAAATAFNQNLSSWSGGRFLNFKRYERLKPSKKFKYSARKISKMFGFSNPITKKDVISWKWIISEPLLNQLF